MSYPLPPVVVVPSASSYPAGSNPWNGTSPTNGGAMSSGFLLYGWTPGTPVAAQDENAWKAMIASATKEALLLASTRPVSSGAFSETAPAFQVFLQSSNLLVEADNVSGKARWATPDNAQSFLSSGSVTNMPTGGLIATWGNRSAPCAYVLDDVFANQVARLLVVSEGSFATPAVDTAFPASAHGGWLDLLGCTDGTSSSVNDVIVALDQQTMRGGTPQAGGGTYYSAIALGASDFRYLGNRGANVYAFSPTHSFSISAANVLVGSGGTLHAATWDGGAIPASCTMFRPEWDVTNARWVVAIANLTSDATLASSAKLYTSTDCFTWVTLATPKVNDYSGTLRTVAVSAIKSVRGVLFAVAYVPNITAAPSGATTEVVVSTDGGLTWLRLGHVIAANVAIGSKPDSVKIDATPSHVHFQIADSAIGRHWMTLALGTW